MREPLAILQACWRESGRVSLTKLAAVLTSGVVLYRAGVDPSPDWGGMAAFSGAAWGLVQVRKHVTREGSQPPKGLA